MTKPFKIAIAFLVTAGLASFASIATAQAQPKGVISLEGSTAKARLATFSGDRKLVAAQCNDYLIKVDVASGMNWLDMTPVV